MGRTLPTVTQQINDTEAALARFRRMLRKSDQHLLDGLFAAARRHTAAISYTDALLPFEAVLLAMLLEQAREIATLRQQMDLLKQNSGHRHFAPPPQDH